MDGAIAMTGQVTLIVYARLPGTSSASTTLTVNELLPTVVGVPASTPAAESASPAGSVPALTENVNGPTPL